MWFLFKQTLHHFFVIFLHLSEKGRQLSLGVPAVLPQRLSWLAVFPSPTSPAPPPSLVLLSHNANVIHLRATSLLPIQRVVEEGSKISCHYSHVVLFYVSGQPSAVSCKTHSVVNSLPCQVNSTGTFNSGASGTGAHCGSLRRQAYFPTHRRAARTMGAIMFSMCHGPCSWNLAVGEGVFY